MPLTQRGLSWVKNIGNWSIVINSFYSDRNSGIYDLRRDAGTVKRLIANENTRHMSTIDGQSHKTLSEAEILGEINDKRQIWLIHLIFRGKFWEIIAY